MYRFGKRPKFSSERMELFYTFNASALLGKFLFFTFPNSIGPTVPQINGLVCAFIMLGFFIVICVEKYDRVNSENPYYTTP